MKVRLSEFSHDSDYHIDRYYLDLVQVPRQGEYITLKIREEQIVFYITGVNHHAIAFDNDSKQEAQILAIRIGTIEEFNSHKRDYEWLDKKLDISKPTKKGWQNTVGKRQVLKHMLKNYSMTYEAWQDLSGTARREVFNQLKEKFDWLEFDWFTYLAKETYERLTEYPGTDIYKYYSI